MPQGRILAVDLRPTTNLSSGDEKHCSNKICFVYTTVLKLFSFAPHSKVGGISFYLDKVVYTIVCQLNTSTRFHQASKFQHKL